jgi:hypothetical protein
MVVLALATTACGGSLGHRSTIETSGSAAVVATVKRVRIELDNGTLGIDQRDERSVQWAGGVRRAADTAEGLKALEAVSPDFQVVADPSAPDTLVLRGPQLPTGATGLLGVEMGIHLPADLELEVRVTSSGHLTIMNRRAALRLDTGRGDLRVERCTGALRAKTGRGHVILQEHRGDVDVHAMVGDMQVFVREPGAQLRLVTGQGTIQCYIPSETPFDLDARAEVGRIGTTFGLPVQTVGDYGAAVVGKQGAGSTKLVLRTGSGHLSLQSRRFE